MNVDDLVMDMTDRCLINGDGVSGRRKEMGSPKAKRIL